MTPPWSLDYHDGSGNAFRARDGGSGASYEYRPTRPEHSSTGHYSGGAAKQGPLSTKAVSALWDLARTLDDATSLRTEVRAKGTGALALRDSRGGPRVHRPTQPRYRRARRVDLRTSSATIRS